jgi:DNA transposition AAA+ family ATPase
MNIQTDVREQLNQWMEERGYSQRKVAQAIGFSDATLSMYRSGQYVGDVKKLEADILNFLQRDAERKAVNKLKLQFTATINSKRLFDLTRMAHIEGEITVVTGDAGTGKTSAAQEYVRRHKDAILIEADMGYTAKILFKELAHRLNLPQLGNIHDLFEDVCQKLKDSGRLIIIDEAEHLPYRALELLRRVHDKAEIGLTLIGLPLLLANLRGKRGEYAQLYSRVGAHIRLETITVDDTAKILETVFPGAGLAKEFHTACKGNTRTLGKLIWRTKRYMEVKEVKLTKDVVQYCANMILI